MLQTLDIDVVTVPAWFGGGRAARPWPAGRRCVAGVLAALALVASVLVTGATPSAALTDRADHTTRLSACVGAALSDRAFTDVSAGHAFREAINCIAYYEITKGTGDGTTFSPEEDVARWQMALFVARAATTAGIDLGSASNQGFSDLGAAPAEARDAINRLAAKKVIPAADAYNPNAPTTRADMAVFLIGLLGLVSPNVNVDSSRSVLLTKGSVTAAPDDFFADVRAGVSDAATRKAINALYELGVTKGTGPTPLTGAAQPGLDLLYSPDGTVNRGQMAAFITRTLAHTGLRPRGVSAQYDGADVVVSVRDSNLRPVSGAAVDVFWVQAPDLRGAFNPNGTCRNVTRADLSTHSCFIDLTDPLTGSDGDVRVEVIGLLRVPAGGATVWAWSGQLSEEVTTSTDLYRLNVAEGADVGFATQTRVSSTLKGAKARLGSTVTYRLQLRDRVGSVTTGIDGVDPAQWFLAVRIVDGNGVANDLPSQILRSDSSGVGTFTISVVDPTPATAGDRVTATYTLTSSHNAPEGWATLDADGNSAVTGTVNFSDEAPSLAQASVTIDTRSYVYLAGGSGGGNTATVTVLDQFGAPLSGARVKLTSSLAGSSIPAQEFTVDGRGQHAFFYQYSGTSAAAETLSSFYGIGSASQTGPTAAVYWAKDADVSGSGRVLAGDIRRNQIVVSVSGLPAMVVYRDDDRFNLAGRPATRAAFESDLAEAIKRPSAGRQLTWSGYSPRRIGPISEYSLN